MASGVPLRNITDGLRGIGHFYREKVNYLANDGNVVEWRLMGGFNKYYSSWATHQADTP